MYSKAVLSACHTAYHTVISDKTVFVWRAEVHTAVIKITVTGTTIFSSGLPCFIYSETSHLLVVRYS